MLNYKDINKDYLDIVFNSSAEDLEITDDHKRNMFYLGMFLLSDRKLNIVNDTKDNLYNNIYNYWVKKHEKEDFLSPNYLSNYFIIATSDFVSKNGEEIKEQFEEEEMEVFFSKNDSFNKLEDFDYKSYIDNLENIGKSNNVVINYDKTSIVSFLDLGLAFYLNNLYPNRRFILWNKGIGLNENNFGDNVISNLLDYSKDKHEENKKISKIKGNF